jgi:hypothetical protein
MSALKAVPCKGHSHRQPPGGTNSKLFITYLFMSTYLSKKSLEKHGSLDEPRDLSRLISDSRATSICAVLAPVGASLFALLLLFLWTFAVPITAVGLAFIYTARFRKYGFFR